MINACKISGVFLLFAVFLQALAMAQTGHYAIFRSQDGGRTWSPSDAGLPPNARINTFGAIGVTLLAGTDAGIFISRNGGIDWKPAAGAATASGRVLSFATLDRSAYAGTDRSGVLVSVDGGINWAANAGTRFRYVRSLLAHRGALYAGTDAQGVFVSRDGGSSWVSMRDGLPSGGQVFSMAGLKGRVFAALYSRGLYVWTGHGSSWRKVSSVSPLVLATAGETLLAGHNPGGIAVSDDYGATWVRGAVSFSEDLGKAPVWDIGSGPDLALAGISSGIYYSADRGRTWTASGVGLPHRSSGIAFLVHRSVVLAGAFVPGSK